MKNVSFVLVSHNTNDLLRRAVLSIKQHYPDCPVIIIDGSDPGNLCHRFVTGLNKTNPLALALGFNIGHGRGMDIGIRLASTEYVVVMDSDAQIIRPCVQAMMDKFGPLTYGVGLVVKTNDRGLNDDRGKVNYLHPYFALIKKSAYMEHHPFLHHGAPCIAAMRQMSRIRRFGVVDFDLSNSVAHDWKGTRRLNPEGFESKNWDHFR